MSKKILLSRLEHVEQIIKCMEQVIESVTLSSDQKTINIEALIKNYKNDLLTHIRDLIDVSIRL